LLQCNPVLRHHYKYEFRFENSWLKEEDIGEVVYEGWNQSDGTGILNRLTNCADKLQRWGRRKMKRFKEQSASMDASVKRQLDTELSAVKLNETATNLDDDSGLVNNINQGANIMV
jgi:hypothetical protein